MSTKSQMGEVTLIKKTNQGHAAQNRAYENLYLKNVSNTQRTQSSSITQQKNTKSKAHLPNNSSVRKAVNFEQSGDKDYIVNVGAYNGLIFDKANKIKQIHPSSMDIVQKQQRVPFWQLSPMNNAPKDAKLSKNKRLEHYLAYSDEDSKPQDSIYALKSNLKNHNIYHTNFKKKTLDHLMLTLQSLQAQNLQLKRQNQLLCNQLQQTRQENSQLFEYITKKDKQTKGIKDHNNSINYPKNYNMSESKTRKDSLLQSKKVVEDEEFIRQCSLQIQRLKNFVQKLVQEKGMPQPSLSQREQIKDRIILKLEDELITAKLLLNEQKAFFLKHKSQISDPKLQSTQRQHHMSHHIHQHNSQPSKQHLTNSNTNSDTLYQNITATNQYKFQGSGRKKLFSQYN